jgi:hypothetical protein
LKAHADIVLIFHALIDGKHPPKFLQVDVTNLGKFPLHLSAAFLYWKVPFSSGFLKVAPLDLTGSALILPKQYPYEISPRSSATFTIWELPTLEREAKKLRGTDTFINRVRFHFIRAFVRTADGKTFRVKLAPGVRKAWAGRATPGVGHRQRTSGGR